MNVISHDWKWSGTLAAAEEPEFIILHHAAAEGSAEAVHGAHLSRGWCGIGYHYYVRLDGSVHGGRPLGTVGAHTVGYNSRSVGVCFEGNFEARTMPQAQLEAGRELIAFLRGSFPHAETVCHRDLDATLCPGKNFPFDELTRTGKKRIFRVQAGAFSDSRRAYDYAAFLRSRGAEDAFVVECDASEGQ